MMICSVTPVRRREDTEGDGNASVKVQIGDSAGVFSQRPFGARYELERREKTICFETRQKKEILKDPKNVRFEIWRLEECEMIEDEEERDEDEN